MTIVGTPEAQWKAQYLIYEKMREEGFVSGTDDVRLTVEILVASSQVSSLFNLINSINNMCVCVNFRLVVLLVKVAKMFVNFNVLLEVLLNYQNIHHHNQLMKKQLYI